MTINKIILISDVHIRLFKRHDEYEQVFKRLYKVIDQLKDDETAICLGGDLVHNKIEMTPELVRMTSNFIKSCADRCPTIIFLGNHDYVANSSNRLDAISPIVNALNHPNVHFWKDSGVYKLGGINFSVFSLLGMQDEWIAADQIKGKGCKIALFHGPVISEDFNNPHIEEGMRAISINKFNGFDIALLGDIHLTNNTLQEYHIFDDEKYPTVKYPGSLICQSYAETPDGHGILIYDVKSKKADFIEIENDYCYFTLNISNNQYTIPKKLPKKVRLRVKYENSSIEAINQAIHEFGKKFTIVELLKQKITTQNSIIHQTTSLGNSRDISYQNQLIEEYLRNNDCDQETINEIKSLNESYNLSFRTSTLIRNTTWNPKKLEFDNMFSYAEGNEIEFENLNGTINITGKNSHGKSCIFDVLCFCLYDKSTRATKAIHILNNSKSTFKCKLNFELNGHDYVIERIGVKNEKTGAVRVDVNFWTYDEENSVVNLNGEDRDQTNKNIREYVGTYDDFIMTALSTQYDNQSFVEKSQRERKDLLYKFLDISIYDELFKAVKEATKEYQILIKDLERENLYDKSSAVYAEIIENERKLETLNELSANIRTEIKSLNDGISKLNKDLHLVDNKLNINEIEEQIKVNISEMFSILNQIERNNETINLLISESNEINDELDGIDNEGFISDSTLESESKLLSSAIAKIESEISKIEFEITLHSKKIKHLESHEYDPNCEFCCKNQFVVDAKESVDLLPKLNDDLFVLIERLATLEAKQFDNQLQLNVRNEKIKLINLLNGKQIEIKLLNERQANLRLKGSNLQERNKILEGQKVEYHAIEEQIIKNNQLNESIQSLKSELKVKELSEEKIQKEHRNCFSQLTSLKKDYEQYQLKIEKYTELLKSIRVHDLYCQALNRDGVPYLILEKVLPLIEYEVNEVLSQVVDFTVKLESTDEKYIHAYIDYGNSQLWPVELSCGMERFILSLAFRTSLTEITSLPKAPFLAIDEGFGVLDSDNLLSMGKLFDFLKTRYNYLLIVSHIESMKDLVERQIRIVKENNFSKIVVE